jgi:hypothetical protein
MLDRVQCPHFISSWLDSLGRGQAKNNTSKAGIATVENKTILLNIFE